MAEDESKVAEEVQDGVEEQQEEKDTTDWKEKARKWEKLAKKNKDAAEELEQLKASQMSEQEQLQARAEKAESELGEYKAQAAKLDAAQQIAKAESVPQELLMFCADEESMTLFAEKFKELTTTQNIAPKAASSRISKGVPEAERTNRDIFAELAEQELQKGF